MTSPHDGHLTHNPSGTRLSFFACGSMGLRTFLNHAMKSSLSNLSEGLRPSDSPARSLVRRFGGSLRSRGSLRCARSLAAGGLASRRSLARRGVALSGARHVIPRALAHALQLL